MRSILFLLVCLSLSQASRPHRRTGGPTFAHGIGGHGYNSRGKSLSSKIKEKSQRWSSQSPEPRPASMDPSAYNSYHFWHADPRDRPFYDPLHHTWICPATPVSTSSNNDNDERDGSEALKEENKVRMSKALEIEEQDEPHQLTSPISVRQAQELDKHSSSSDFEDALEQVTGIRVRKRNFVQASAFGFRSGSPTVEMAKPAYCQPEPTVVELDLDFRPGVFYFPTCTRVNRCGGCCSHELLECQPTKVSKSQLTVIKTEFGGGNHDSAATKQIVMVEVHEKCSCDCKVKQEDCHVGQIYLPHECRCMCRNSTSEHLCLSQPTDKYWDPSACRCKCKNVHECSTGMEFNDSTCRCERMTLYSSARRGN